MINYNVLLGLESPFGAPLPKPSTFYPNKQKQEVLLQAIDEVDPPTSENIARHLGRAASNVRDRLARLKRIGLADYEMKGNWKLWKRVK